MDMEGRMKSQQSELPSIDSRHTLTLPSKWISDDLDCGPGESSLSESTSTSSSDLPQFLSKAKRVHAEGTAVEVL